MLSYFKIYSCSLLSLVLLPLYRPTWAEEGWSILKEISPEYSLEGLMLKLKLQSFGHLIRTDSFEDPDAGKDRRWEDKGTIEDEMTGWHHQLNEHDFE